MKMAKLIIYGCSKRSQNWKIRQLRSWNSSTNLYGYGKFNFIHPFSCSWNLRMYNSGPGAI